MEFRLQVTTQGASSHVDLRILCTPSPCLNFRLLLWLVIILFSKVESSDFDVVVLSHGECVRSSAT